MLQAGALTFIIFVSVVGTLVLSALLFVMQVAQRTRDFHQQAAQKQKRLLRYVRTDEPVQLPALEPGHYHLFLSQCAHNWIEPLHTFYTCNVRTCAPPTAAVLSGCPSSVQCVEDWAGQLPRDQAAAA